MKAKTVFVTVSNLHGIIDYPQNVPIPRIGETVITERSKLSGKVYDIRHILSGNLLEIKILVLPD